jgi:hypothetical protein
LNWAEFSAQLVGFVDFVSKAFLISRIEIGEDYKVIVIILEWCLRCHTGINVIMGKGWPVLIKERLKYLISLR